MSRATSAKAESATPAAWLKAQRTLAGRWLSASVVLAVAGGVLMIAQAWLIARSVDAVVFDDAILAEVAPWLWTVLVLLAGRALLAWAVEQTAFRASAQVRVVLRDTLLRRLQAAGPARLTGARSGELATALSDGIEALDAYYARYLPATLLMALLPLAILVVVVPADWLSALILLLTAPLIPLFMILIGRGAERLNQRQWRTLARLSAHFLDVIQGLATLKVFNASRRETANIARASDDYRASTMAVLRVAFLSSLALEFFATVSIAVVAVSIGFRLLWGEMDFLYGFFVLLLAPEFYLPLRNMGTHYHARMEAIGAAERLLDIPAAPAPPAPSALRAAPSPARVPIHFEKVLVEYPGGIRALDGIDLVIAPGERVAIVGPSGAGKSTLFNLLLGFLQPSAGRLVIGDTPLSQVDPAAWRAQIAWVAQRPHLFATSVANNILLAREDASDAQIEDAARRAHAVDFITMLPGGFATPIGDGGVGLSGGQAQRIALARAFLRDAALLLLDEPTAHLDADSERGVQQAIDDLAEGRSVLTIAHRLDSVRRADRIIVLDRGRIVGQGSHDTLLDDCAVYARLVDDLVTAR